MKSRLKSLQAGPSIAVLCSLVFAGEAKAGNAVSIWFKTPGDKYETYADSSTRGVDSNGNVYYYYNPARPMDNFPVCVDPNGLQVYYRYLNQDHTTYYQLGGALWLWHGRMEAFVGRNHYTADDQGDLYIPDLPNGSYVIQGYALLHSAYIATTDGHLSWFSNQGAWQIDNVAYFNAMSYLGSATGKYQANTWYDLMAPSSYNGWHPYWNGFEFYGGYVAIDLRISSISSQHVTRVQ